MGTRNAFIISAKLRFIMIGVLVALCFLGPIAAQKVSDSCACGIENMQKRIIGGEKAKANRYPWMVAIVTPNQPEAQFCGGSLVSDRHILTAAHCVDSSPVENVSVVLGAHKLSQAMHTLPLASIQIERTWNRRAAMNDLALLTLASPVTFSKTVSPVCLPTYRDKMALTNLFVTGWGTVHPTQQLPTDGLMEVSVPEIDGATCQKMIPLRHIAPHVQICAGQSGHDSCRGDSGGPLQTRVGGQVYQAGIVSFGSEYCADGGPTVYTRLSLYMDWVGPRLSEGTTCRKL